MAQNTNLAHSIVRYTRADFTALRAVMNKVPIGTILSLYYCDDDRDLLGLETAADLHKRMDAMRDYLIERATDTNPHVASFLQDARRTSVWSKAAINWLVTAADEDLSSPRPTDPLSLWFKQRVVTKLEKEGCKTVIDLANLINIRGHGWYLPIPRFGEKGAEVIQDWFTKHNLVRDLIDAKRLLPAVALGDVVEINLQTTVLAPLERIRLSPELDGRHGINRCQSLCTISARDDLAAVRAYLKKFDGRPKTHRSYEKEIERFLLWCVLWKRKPMSDMLGEDCEEYKAFIKDPPKSWCGKRRKRGTSSWFPFTGSMSPGSQRYAIRVLRYFFSWLVDMRYLNGNSWKAVSDPVVDKEELPLQINKALSADLWHKLADEEGILDWLCTMPEEELRAHFTGYGVWKTASMGKQMRLVRAAVVLMGETGLRREEAARATRDKLKPAPENPALWELQVTGKGRKKRTVVVPLRVIEVLRAHWEDREIDFSYGMSEIPLLSPVTLPPIDPTKARHQKDDGSRKEAAFTVDGLGRLVSKALTRIANDSANPYLEPNERAALMQAAAHALRHTFGTLTVAADVPLDVVQKSLGHASLQTTTIYVQAERKRLLEEMAKKQNRKKRAILQIASTESPDATSL